MLTQGERRQMTGEVPSVSLPPERPEKGEVLSLPSSSSPVEQKPLTAPLPVLQQPVEAAPVAPVVQEIQPPLGMMGPDEEESFFGPEWLKALGAATMEEAVNTAQVAEPVAPVSSQEASAEISSAARAPTSVWGQLAEISHAKQPFKVEKEVAAEIASIAKTAQHVEETEKAAPITLETLEHNLRFSDFGSLEQSLHAAVAQGQEALVAMQPDESDQQQRMYQEPTLSAALAELENFGQPLTSPVAFAIAPDSTRSWSASVKPSPAPLAEEPAWLASLRATPIAPPPLVNEELPVQGQVPTMPVFATEIPVARPAEPPARVEAVPEPVSVPTPALAMLLSGMVEPVKAEPMKVEPVKTPVAHVDPFLDIELETTMKRPAIRLQPMQQRPASQGNQPASVIQGRTGEWLASKEARGSMSHRERLLKGYQHQLVGDYDEAMQEYRLIIRNVPELLGEVISNIRALLKLAPKYAAGYRVLGDAYMCQGEYLQAMEAYNKALTMAKKAKA
jgi:tetratricopeptide (TPR) repeat protein